MKIFASWSGDDSKRAAELLRDWLPNVLQEVEVWVSSRDIDRGEKWSVTLWDSLSDHDFGIILLTKTNFNAPWILFEAGALSKSLKSRVVPILLNVDRIEIVKSPLNQLQNITIDRGEIRDLILDINRTCIRPLANERVTRAFDKWWPELEVSLKEIDYRDDRAPSEINETGRLARIEDALSAIMGTLKRANSGTVLRATGTTSPQPGGILDQALGRATYELGIANDFEQAEYLLKELKYMYPLTHFHSIAGLAAGSRAVIAIDVTYSDYMQMLNSFRLLQQGRHQP